MFTEHNASLLHRVPCPISSPSMPCLSFHWPPIVNTPCCQATLPHCLIIVPTNQPALGQPLSPGPPCSWGQFLLPALELHLVCVYFHPLRSCVFLTGKEGGSGQGESESEQNPEQVIPTWTTSHPSVQTPIAHKGGD